MLMYLILFSSAVVNTPKPNVFNTLIALLWSWTGSTLDLMLNIENVTAFFYRQIMTAFSPQNLFKKCSLQLLSLKETFVFEFPNPLACLLWRKLEKAAGAAPPLLPVPSDTSMSAAGTNLIVTNLFTVQSECLHWFQGRDGRRKKSLAGGAGRVHMCWQGRCEELGRSVCRD